jgi:hypothetical protein
MPDIHGGARHEKVSMCEARGWEGDPTNQGVLGSSGDRSCGRAGGHAHERFARYNAIPMPGEAHLGAVAYFVTSILPFMAGCSPQM